MNTKKIIESVTGFDKWINKYKEDFECRFVKQDNFEIDFERNLVRLYDSEQMIEVPLETIRKINKLIETK